MKLIHQGNHQLLLSNNKKLNFPLHLQNGVEIICLRSGSTTLHYAGKKYNMVSGDLLVVFPSMVHGFTNSKETDSIMMLIPIDNTASFRSLLERKEPLLPILKKPFWEETGLAQILEMAHHDWGKANEAIQQGYVLLVLGKLIPLLSLIDRNPNSGDVLYRAMTYLHEHYVEPITRKQLASALGYNESYISHIFSDILHTTLTDYLLQLRLDKATNLMANTQLTISSIAMQAGFGSIRSFNRAFLKTMGCTPKEYRKSQ